VFKGDDDVLIIPENLFQIIKKIENDENGMIGCLKQRPPVVRTIENKYFMPNDIIDEDVYPAYFSGAAYIVSGGK